MSATRLAGRHTTRPPAILDGMARSVFAASPSWLQPRLRSARKYARRRVAAWQAERGPLLSVVVPVYNVAEYLPGCLDSLLAQKYQNLEILVVDDGSPDNSHEIAETYASRDPRIRIITRPNGGLSAARNTGIDAATGEYLTFVDSDDAVLPDAYDTAMSTLARTGSDFAVFSYQRMNSTRRWAPPRWIQEAHAHTHLHTTIEQFPEAQANAISCSKVFNHSFWSASGLRFPEGVVYEDQPVTTRAYACATAFDFLPGRYYLWRQREDQSSISQQVRTVADLQARVVAARTSLDILRRSGRAHAHDTRLTQFLANDFPQSLVLAADTDDEFWACLRDGMRSLTAAATPDIWAQVSPQHRLLYDLVTGDHRAETLQVLEAGGGNLKNFPTRVTAGHVYAELPYHDDPVLMPDPTRLELRPHQLRIQTAVRRLTWTSPTTLAVHGWAYFDNIDLATNPTHVTLTATDTDTGHVATIPATARPDPSVSRISRHKHCNYENSAFVATIDTDDLPARPLDHRHPQTWQFDVGVHTAGLHDHAPLHGVNRWGSAGEPSARLDAAGVLTEVRTDQAGRLELVRSRPAAWLQHVEIYRRSVTLQVRSAGDVALEAVEVSDRARNLKVTAPVGQAADGSYTVSFTLPAADGGRWGWYVRGVTDDGDQVPIGWPNDLGDCQSTTDSDHFEGVWAARTPAGNVTLAQQLQRCRIRTARLSETGDTLLVEADLDGHGNISARLQGRPLTSRGRQRRDGRTLHLSFPLTATAWNGPALPLPPGRYDLDLRRSIGDGSERLVVDLSDDVLSALPVDIEHPRLRGRIERTTVAGHLCLTITAPLAPDERGARHQRELQDQHAAWPTSPEPNAVLFRTSYGENAACNAAAIHRELVRRNADLRLYWGVRDYSVHVPEGGIPVVIGSREWYRLLRTAGYYVDNMHQPIYHDKPDHQVLVETFHGYPFKRMGHPHWRNLGFPQSRIDSFDRRAADWDYLVSPASYATPLLRRDFHYQGRILEIGYPRNDVLQSPQAGARRESVRQRLGLGHGQLAVLYAPTFRDYLSADDHHADMVDFLDLERVSASFGEEAVLLLRGHAFNARTGRTVDIADNVLDVTGYPDVADLYLAADAAIVDYSSLRFDFGLTGKPMIFHVPDLARYRDESRGWLFDYEPTAPGPHVDTTDEVLHELSRLDHVRSTYRDAYARFRRDYLDLDDGHAAERFVDAVFVPRGHASTRSNGSTTAAAAEHRGRRRPASPHDGQPVLLPNATRASR